MPESYITSHPRFVTVLKYLQSHVTGDCNVLEVGGEAASFCDFLPACNNWLTIDKFGKPTYRIDIEEAGLRLPIESSSIDIIVCTQVLEHLLNAKSFLDEITRIVKPRGFLVVSVPNLVGLKSRIFTLLGKIPPMAASGDLGPDYGTHGTVVDGLVVGGHVIDYDYRRLEYQLRRSGLTVTEVLRTPFTFRIFGRRISFGEKFMPMNLMDNIVVRAEKIVM